MLRVLVESDNKPRLDFKSLHNSLHVEFFINPDRNINAKILAKLAYCMQVELYKQLQKLESSDIEETQRKLYK